MVTFGTGGGGGGAGGAGGMSSLVMVQVLVSPAVIVPEQSTPNVFVYPEIAFSSTL